MPEKTSTRVDRMEQWFRNQPVLSVLIFFGIAVIAVSEFADHGSDLLVKTGVTQEKTLQLATENAKGDLSRKLVALASRRIFWTRNYYRRVELERSPGEVDYAWDKYLDSVADWSADLITNLNAMAEYYPRTPKMDKPAEFNRIHEEFRDLETVLVDLRTTEESLRKKQPAQVFKQQKEEVKELVCRVRSAADQINIDVYMFALNRREEDATKVVAARPIGANFRNQYKLPPARNDVSPRVHPASVVFAFEAENAFGPGVSFRADFEQLVSAARKCASPHERVVLLRGRFTSDYAQRTGDTGNGVLSLTTR